MFNFIFGTVILFVVTLILIILITQMVWNIVIPNVFGLKQITFSQTLGLLILAHIFFGGHVYVCNATSYNSQ